TVASQSALSVIAELARPNTRTSPVSGSVAPVARLMNTSAAARSRPTIATSSRSAIRRSAIRSGRSPPYCFDTPANSRADLTATCRQHGRVFDRGRKSAATGSNGTERTARSRPASRSDLLVDLVDDAARLDEGGDFDFRGGEVARDRAVSDRRVHHGRQHARVDARAENRGHHRGGHRERADRE